VEDEQIEFTFFAGELIPTSELAAMHRVTPAEDDEVEFVSPSVPGTDDADVRTGERGGRVSDADHLGRPA
jgi:hypothetical protein